jgi:hypothetical protein
MKQLQLRKVRGSYSSGIPLSLQDPRSLIMLGFPPRVSYRVSLTVVCFQIVD